MYWPFLAGRVSLCWRSGLQAGDLRPAVDQDRITGEFEFVFAEDIISTSSGVGRIEALARPIGDETSLDTAIDDKERRPRTERGGRAQKGRPDHIRPREASGS